MNNTQINSVNDQLTNQSLGQWLARLFGHTKQQTAMDEPSFRFVGRLSSEEIGDFLEKSLGRRLTPVEIAALDEGYRPQGLLDPDDCYRVRLSSPRYLGTFAPELEFFSTAVDGYADGDPLLKLAETVAVHMDDGVEVVDNELVASF